MKIRDSFSPKSGHIRRELVARTVSDSRSVVGNQQAKNPSHFEEDKEIGDAHEVSFVRELDLLETFPLNVLCWYPDLRRHVLLFFLPGRSCELL